MKFRSTLFLGLGLMGALCAAGLLSARGSKTTTDKNSPVVKEQTWSSWNERGRSKAHRGDAPGAIECFHRAIELNPSSAMLRMNRGSAFLQLNQLELALADFDTAVALDPAYPELRLNRGQARAGLADWSGAVMDLRTALALAPASWQFRKFTERKLEEAQRHNLVRFY